jgi:hypothetical protein
VNDNRKFEKAHQAIGEYFAEFSQLERELGEAVKVVLHLEGHEAADLVVDLLRYPRYKANLVKGAAEIATKKKDGSEISTEWKERARKTLGDILSHNEKCRDYLAHSHLEPQEDGSVEVTRRNKGKSENWKLQPKIDEVQRLTKELKDIRAELSKLDVQVGKIQFAEAVLGHDLTQPPLLTLREHAAATQAGVPTKSPTSQASK